MNSEYKAVLQSVEDELPFQITWYDALESLLSIDSVLVSCEEQLDKVDLGVNYESQEAKLDKALTDRGYIEKYLENVQDYVLTNLDEKLYKWFNNGPTEAISTISLDDYSTEDHKSEIYCNYIKFTDFMGASGDGAFIEANKKAYVGEFEDIFANQYQSYKENGYLSDEVELDEYIDTIVMQGSFNHQMDKPVESFVSGVLDVTIIKPLIESVIGVDLITHDDLNGLERGMKGVSALLSIYAIGTVLLGTNVSKIGTQEALTYTAKTMVVDSSAQLTALGVQKVGEICDLPVAITIILSFISGIVVSTKVDGIEIQWKNVSKTIDPPSGNVDKIKDAGIITEGSVGSIESGSSSVNLPRPGEDGFIGPLTRPEHHFIFGEGIGPKQKGVVGAHNMNYFEQTLARTGFGVDDLKIGSPVPHPTINGIYSQRYTVPAYDGRGNFIGFKNIKDPKTIYDPTVISNRQMLDWGWEAMDNGVVSGRIIEGSASNGLKFRGYIGDDGSVTNFFPIFE